MGRQIKNIELSKVKGHGHPWHPMTEDNWSDDGSTVICCICKEPLAPLPGSLTGYDDHNAAPAGVGRCCEGCNQDVVIPFRLAKMQADSE